MAATHRSQRLSPMQERFVQEYLVDCNATAAYKRAGYKGQGNVAEVNAHRLLRQAKVAAAVQAAQDARAQRLQLTQDAVLHELTLLAHADIADYVIDDHGAVTLRAGGAAARDALHRQPQKEDQPYRRGQHFRDHDYPVEQACNLADGGGAPGAVQGTPSRPRPTSICTSIAPGTA